MDTAERISRLSPEQRKLLEQKLQKENIDILKLSINKQKRSPDQESSGQQRFQLSFAQERLWFIQQLDPDNYAYNITKLLKLEGILDKQALEQGINEIIKRHEILRTVFIPEPAGPVQVSLDRLSLPLETMDLQHPAKNQNEIQRITQEESQYVFDLSQGPLLRTRLLILEEKKYIFLLVIHHIICDGTSFQVFFRELMEFYQFFSRGKPVNLPQLTIQYANYVCWQRQWSNFNTKQAAYWLAQFKGEIPVLQLPTDYPRPSLQGFKGDTIGFYLPGPGVKVLKEIAVKEKATLNVVLLALYNVFLSRLSSQEDIVVGTPIAGRRHPAVKNLIGMFVNTLALRNYPLHHLTLKEFLASVTQRTLKAFDNQEYEYEYLIDKVQVNRDTSRNPLFDVMFFLGNIEFPIIDIQGLTLKSYDPDNKTSKFDLLLRAREEGDRLHFYLEYCTSLFKEVTIERFIGYFKQVVAAAVNNKDLNIKLPDMEILPAEEKKHILYDFNNTSAGYPLNKTLDQLFSKQAEQTPDHIAVICRQQHLTYRELAQLSGRLAHLLGEKGVQPDTIVAVMMERSLEMIISVLGILKAGGAYLPIEPGYPEERIKYMLADSKANILIKNGNIISDLESRQELFVLNFEHLNFEFVSNFDVRISDLNASNLAYIIYTSGSTGKPKGVMLEQQNLVNLLFYDFKCTTLDFSAVLQFSTISFDASFHEIFTTLLQGGKLCLIDEEMRTNVPELFKLIREKQIKTVFLPMALLKLIFNEPTYISLFPTCVSHIQTAGEQVVINNAFRDFLKSRQIPLHNHYGPSETHVVTALTLFPTGDIPELPSIGKPVSNTQVYILDKHERIQPLGVPGELYIGGVQVGRGYMNNPELTNSKFQIQNPKQIPNPKLQITNKEQTTSPHQPITPSPHSPIYRTGDLARWLEDGNIEFLGRIDYQVKIRGYRVEVGEIEAQLLNHDAVQEAVVLEKADHRKEKYLCAYIKKKEIPEPIGFEELRTYLSGKLPDYMIPAYFVFLDQVPLTPSGKIDRKALPHPGAPLLKKYIAPRDEVEKKIVELWVEVLGKSATGTQPSLASPGIGVEDNFFQLGGHSLKAAVLISRIHKAFHVNIPLKEIFNHPTIAQLAIYIKNASEEKHISIKPVEKKEFYPVSSPQKRLYLLQQIELNSTAYNIPQLAVLEGTVDKSRWQGAFKRLIRRHEILRTSFILVDDEPVQEIHEEVEFEIKYYSATEDRRQRTEDRQQRIDDRRKTTEEGSDNHLSSVIRHLSSEFIRPFDLSQAPLFRVGLMRLEEQKHLLMLNIHHIITDKTSMEILITGVIKLYAGETLRELPLQYKDFSGWQNKWLVSEAIKPQERYWQKQFSGEVPVLDLPTDYPKPGVQNFAGNTVHFRIPGQQIQALKSAAPGKGLTMFMVLLGLFDIFLAKISGQEDILVGIPTAGRRHTDLQPIIGMFVNTLVSRNHPAAEKKPGEFLEEVKENTLNAFANQDYQFEMLIEKIDLKRDLSRNPLFNVMFSFNTDADIGKVREIIIPGLKLKGCSPDTIPGSKLREVKRKKFPYENKTSKFDLTLRVFEEEDEVDFSFEYCTKLFKETTVQRFIAYFKQIVETVIDNINNDLNLGIADIDIIPGKEKKQLLYHFNHTRASFPLDKTIHQLFIEQVKKTPDHIAVLGTHEPNERGTGLMSITYREFNRRADVLARVLRSKGVKANTAVGIMAEPLPAAIAAIMAILKTGGFYLPLDPDQPPQRISYLLVDSQIRWLLTQKSLTASSPIQFEGEFIDINYYNSQGNHMDPYRLDQEQNQDIPSINQGNNFAYMIYTSGTTGKSKGVLLRHINLVNYVSWFKKENRLNSSDRSLLTASFAFDLGYTSIYPCLLSGGQLHLAARETYATAGYLLDYIRDHALSYLKLTPSLFSIIAENPGLSSRMLRTLRLVVLGGEEIRTRDVENLHKYCSHIQFINHYGPTEATIGTIAQQIDFSRFNEYRQQPTIGKPISNSRVYILDKQLQLLPIGVPGELFLSGVCLAGGYLNNPELTAERFLFFNYRSYRSYKTYISKKIYRTGDLARWLADGNIEFLGRDDQQVKLRGYRVELGEIENRVKEYPGIKDAAVLVNPDKTGDKYLCAYITPAVPGEPVEIKELMEYLSHLLPGYMIPSTLVKVECIPLTPNGKIDRRALPQPGPGQSQGQYIAPRDEIEEKLAEIWSDLLNRDALPAPTVQPQLKIGIEDNFFQLGGQSLKAALVTARVHKEFHVKISLSMVFQAPTIKHLAAYIRKAKTHRHTVVETAEKREYYELSSAQKRLYILQQMELGSTAYNNMRILLLEGELERNRLEQVGKELIKRHESLRTSFEMVNGEPVQWIHEFAEVEFQVEYISPDHGAPSPLSHASAVKDFIRPFELSRAPLLRVGLIELEETSFLLVVDMHHIITDAVSRRVFERDFLALCAGRKLPYVRLQYRDYSQWQNHPGQKISLKKQEQYWGWWFAGEIPVLNMPTDYPRPPIQRFKGSEIHFEIDRELSAKIRGLTAETDVTMYMVLLAAYNILLSKYTGQYIILVGSPASCRTNADLHQIIGLFANILVMKNMPNRDKRFQQFLAEVKQHALGAFENQDYQFNDLVEQLDVPGTRDRHPLIDTVFAFQDITDTRLGDKDSSLETLAKDNIKVSPYKFRQQVIQHELLLSATERPDNITLMLQYSTVLFKESTARGMSNHYIEILKQITQNPKIILKDIKISIQLAAMPTDSKEEEGDFDF